jgi:hypothetical protein
MIPRVLLELAERVNVGHFPMSEHPRQFRRYLLPVLEEIRARP